MNQYILDVDGKTPKKVDDVLEWSRWFETANRHVDKTVLDVNGEEVTISTVFLGLDHNYGSWTGNLEEFSMPILFETMVFGGEFNDSQERYTTWELAEEGHKMWTMKVLGYKPEEK